MLDQTTGDGCFWTGVIPAIIFFGLLLRAPETPRYLMMAGRTSQAAGSWSASSSPDEVSQELETMRASFGPAAKAGATFCAQAFAVP